MKEEKKQTNKNKNSEKRLNGALGLAPLQMRHSRRQVFVLMLRRMAAVAAMSIVSMMRRLVVMRGFTVTLMIATMVVVRRLVCGSRKANKQLVITPAVVRGLMVVVLA